MGIPAAAVSSVFGRTGAVVAQANDYNFSQLAGSLASGQDYAVGTTGTYTKVTTNAQGRVSSGGQASAADLSNGTQGSGNIVLATSPTITSPTITTPTISGALGANLDLGSNATLMELANDTTTGTTLNALAKLTGNPSKAVIGTTSDTSGMMGIVVGGAGTTGNAQIAINGVASCIFDGATTAGDYVQISSTTGGDCHDAGASIPSSGQIIGMVLSTNAAGGTYAIRILSGNTNWSGVAISGSAVSRWIGANAVGNNQCLVAYGKEDNSIACSNTTGAPADDQELVPHNGGTAAQLQVRLDANANGTGGAIVTLLVNGTASALTCTVAPGSRTCFDSTHSVILAAGDVMQVQVTYGAGTGNRQFSVSYRY
jgi:hypothetical protein